MSAPATIAEFLSFVRKSGLLGVKELNDYLERLRRTRRLPVGPAALAAQLVRDGLLTKFQARMLLNGRSKGFVLGKYRLLDRLGVGGMSTVFLAEHIYMKRLVALKVLASSRAENPSFRGRFLREAQIVAALNHPNIVHAYDIDTEGSVYFLVMEYIDGVNFQELVSQSGRLEPVRAAHYIRQTALGLQHAHENGLVHRDIKPANLLVNRAGVVKILDMGLARFFQDETDALTREQDARAILGTADYLAPEQSRDSHEVDIRADIYSLGATFFFLLTGRPLFDGGTLNQKLVWQRMKPPPDVRELRPEVPNEMAALLARMVAKNPQERPQTPDEVAAFLLPWTQAPLAPPTAEELPEPCSSLRASRGRRSGSVPRVRAVKPSDAEAEAIRMTNLDLASPSRITRIIPPNQ